MMASKRGMPPMVMPRLAYRGPLVHSPVDLTPRRYAAIDAMAKRRSTSMR